MLGTITAEGCKNKHCTEVASDHCQTSQTQEVPKLQGTQVCDPQGDQEDIRMENRIYLCKLSSNFQEHCAHTHSVIEAAAKGQMVSEASGRMGN